MLPDLLSARAGLIAGRRRAAHLLARSRASAASEALRPPSVVNLLDDCAHSLPCHAPDEFLYGAMIRASALHDERLLDAVPSVEQALALRGE